VKYGLVLQACLQAIWAELLRQAQEKDGNLGHYQTNRKATSSNRIHPARSIY